MPLPPLADIDLVEDLFGGEINAVQATLLLDYTSALVRARADQDWETDVPDGIPEVVAGAVVRVLQNPTGATQTQTGPFGASYGPAGADRIYLSAADKAIIDAAAGRSSQAFSIDPTVGHDQPIFLGADAEFGW